MKKIFIYSVLFALLFIACDQEDFTGYSTIVPTSPTISVTGIPAVINFIEKDSTFSFTVTLSTPQVVDIVLVTKQIAGTATEGEDYVILNDAGKLTIPAGATTGQVRVKILADDLEEETETITLQIGDQTTANATFAPVTVEFTIGNFVSDVLSVDMSWATDALSQIGLNVNPLDAVDLRLLIINASDHSIVKIEDGAAFESYSDFNALPDGDYIVAADIYSTINAGDFNKPLNIDIALNFFQSGVLDEELIFPAVMSNVNACDLYRTNLATVNKAGDVYTVTKAISYDAPEVLTWNGIDADYDSEVTTTENCEGNTMTGLGFEWMADWWGEVIVSGGTLSYTISGDNITIPLQKYCRTTWNGAPQPEYSIQGTGTIDNSGAYPVYTIIYDFIQGESIASYINDNGWWPTDYFEAIITTEPDSKGSKGLRITKIISKPVRK